MIQNQTQIRKIKQSPTSLISLHQKVLNNCIDAIRSKRHTKLNLLRNSYITQRNGSINENTNQHDYSRKELMENFVNEIYNETIIENDMNDHQNDAEFSIDALTEIMQAIEIEMQEFEMSIYEEQLQDEEALEQYIQYSLYDEFSVDNQYYQDNNIICPVCMLCNMNTMANQLQNIISCNTCGTNIHLQVPTSIIDFKNRLAFIYDSHSITCEDNAIGLNSIENKTALFNTSNNIERCDNNSCTFNINNYDNNHHSYTNNNNNNNSNKKVNNDYVSNKTNVRLTFHMNNEHLYAYCSECAFNIQVI